MDNVQTDDKIFICAYCSKIYKSRCGIKNHVSGVHGNVVFRADSLYISNESVCGDYACDYCSLMFATVDDKRFHLMHFHKVRSAAADEEVESTRREFELELETEAEKCPYSCRQCGKSFTRKFNLSRHERTHSTTFDLSRCDLCGKVYSTLYTLKRHKAHVHKTGGAAGDEDAADAYWKFVTFVDGTRYLKCNYCSYMCPQKTRFKEHYRKHTGERPFTCDQCGKQFRLKKFLQNHLKYVHEGVKEHPCDICGRCFSDKRYTEAHRRTHTGEKPYVCDLCGRMFTQQASLFMHKEMHAKVPKHKCHVCLKAFFYRGSLAVHVKRHAGVLNYKCDVCKKAFVDRKNLRRHEAVHSDDRPFSCALCGAAFKLKKYLKQHGRIHRKTNNPQL